LSYFKREICITGQNKENLNSVLKLAGTLELVENLTTELLALVVSLLGLN
jgi:hypothetical protein